MPLWTLSELNYELDMLAEGLERKGFTNKMILLDMYATEVSMFITNHGDGPVSALGIDWVRKLRAFIKSCKNMPDPLVQ